MFLSAVLIFWVQPMFGKMILPLLGSTPNVWNTCVMFFQAALLGGYVYAHASISWLGVRRQAMLHTALLILPIFFLPIVIPQGWYPPVDQNPVPWLLTLMLVAVGLPFFVASASAPMLQKWFASTNHPSSSDPYFLYAASNIGSMIALIGYPFLLEPNFRLIEQSELWKYLYIVLVILTISCSYVLLKAPQEIARSTPHDPIESSPKDSLSLALRIRWILLSMIPSSLMLSVTTYLSTDIAAVPLLWVIPLSIYLFTFVLVFAKKPPVSHEMMVRFLPIVVLPVMIYILAEQSKAAWLTFFFHLLVLFIACMVCHGELARTRPSTKHLTEFYLLISLGGFFGGAFNALVAPVLFNTVIEYPIALVLACLLRPNLSSKESTTHTKVLDVVLPVVLGLFTLILCLGFNTVSLKPDWLGNLFTFAVPALLCYIFATRPIRFALGIGIVMIAISFSLRSTENILYTERSFFAVHRVVHDKYGKYSEAENRYLVHGRILHGAQSVKEENKKIPLTYFYPTGPIGQVFTSLQNDKTKSNIAVIGLGAGTLAAYAKPWQNWALYEIDPVVKHVASDKKYFTYLHDCPCPYEVILGDGRLSIQRAADGKFDIIVLDAFSSDSIPTHLVTLEAMKLYLKKLNKGGILAFNVTNNYLDIKPVLADLALENNLVVLYQNDFNILDDERELGKKPSSWVILAREQKDFGSLVFDKRWASLQGNKNRRIWTDDFSNIFSVVKFTPQ